ncbi:MAG: cell division protein FtsX [Pseudomonadota bacterium]
MNRESPLLPHTEAREAALFFVIGALCFLAALAALTTRGTYAAAAAWGDQIEGEFTVVLQDTDRRTATGIADDIAQMTGIDGARLLSEAELDELLAPSFGPGGLPDGLPLPLLIAVQAAPDAPDPEPAITTILDQAEVEGEVSGHGGFARQVQRALAVLRLIGIGAVSLLAATAIAVIAFATHAALLARKDIVDVLHLSGAEDRFIARLFARRFWVLALQAGSGGALAALMTTALIVFSASSSGAVESQLLPRLSLDIVDFAILVVTPVIAGLAARGAARITVLQALKGTM